MKPIVLPLDSATTENYIAISFGNRLRVSPRDFSSGKKEFDIPISSRSIAADRYSGGDGLWAAHGRGGLRYFNLAAPSFGIPVSTGLDEVSAVETTEDGRLLFLGTSRGLRVFDAYWREERGVDLPRLRAIVDEHVIDQGVAVDGLVFHKEHLIATTRDKRILSYRFDGQKLVLEGGLPLYREKTDYSSEIPRTREILPSLWNDEYSGKLVAVWPDSSTRFLDFDRLWQEREEIALTAKIEHGAKSLPQQLEAGALPFLAELNGANESQRVIADLARRGIISEEEEKEVTELQEEARLAGMGLWFIPFAPGVEAAVGARAVGAAARYAANIRPLLQQLATWSRAHPFKAANYATLASNIGFLLQDWRAGGYKWDKALLLHGGVNTAESYPQFLLLFGKVRGLPLVAILTTVSAGSLFASKRFLHGENPTLGRTVFEVGWYVVITCLLTRKISELVGFRWIPSMANWKTYSQIPVIELPEAALYNFILWKFWNGDRQDPNMEPLMAEDIPLQAPPPRVVSLSPMVLQK